MDIREEYKNSGEISGKDAGIKLLYWGHWKSDQVIIQPHVHPYWQIEFILEGTVRVLVEKEEFTLSAGDVLLIPPMNRHTFLYQPQIVRESWSLKFDFELFAPGPAARHIKQGNDLLSECVKNSLTVIQRLHLYYETDPLLLQSLLKVILLTLYRKNLLVAQELPLLKKLRSLIETKGYSQIKARKLARECSYSADHLSVLVKKATGLSLKSFIDHEIMLHAERLLANTDFAIGEIADKLGFRDQYAFSHFFRNNSGTSPTAYRKSLGDNYFPERIF